MASRLMDCQKSSDFLSHSGNGLIGCCQGQLLEALALVYSNFYGNFDATQFFLPLTIDLDFFFSYHRLGRNFISEKSYDC